jgi:gentisate 1,2-dioxygenase
LPPIQEWNKHGTTDDIGRWPAPGPECRKEPIYFYKITEEKKLINVHGTDYPMLIKFFVSNDYLNVFF